MIKNVFVILLMAVIPCLSQVDVRIAERLALDTAHAYDAYYQELIETERSLQGIGGNILGTAVGATLTAVGVLFVVAGDGFAIRVYRVPPWVRTYLFPILWASGKAWNTHENGSSTKTYTSFISRNAKCLRK